MDIISEQKKLYAIFNETIELIPHRSKRKFNLNTIENFIIHIDKVDSKSICAEAILEYLKYIRTFKTPPTISQTNDLFKNFIFPIAPIYTRIGFTFNTTLTTSGLLFLFPTLLLLTMNAAIWWYIVSGGILFIYLVFLFHKKKQHKVWGLRC